MDIDKLRQIHRLLYQTPTTRRIINSKTGEVFKNNLEYEELGIRDKGYIDYYYRKRINSTNPWGYNFELNSWFFETHNRYGFKEASFRFMFIDELKLLRKYEYWYLGWQKGRLEI